MVVRLKKDDPSDAVPGTAAKRSNSEEACRTRRSAPDAQVMIVASPSLENEAARL